MEDRWEGSGTQVRDWQYFRRWGTADSLNKSSCSRAGKEGGMAGQPADCGHLIQRERMQLGRIPRFWLGDLL